jgi:NTE family protein
VAEATDQTPKRAIVLAGGGARGAYEAGVLRYLFEDFKRDTGIDPTVDIVCGTSVGAIHACYLAANIHDTEGHGNALVKIWEELRADEVFRFRFRDLFKLPRRMMGMRRVAESLAAGRRPDRLFGLLDTDPLERLVLNAIPWKGIRENIRAGVIESVCIAATQIATGRAVVFVEQKDRALPSWADQTNIRMQPIRLMPVHALASAAIPLLFPAVRVGARYYADGGLRLNTPLAPAVRLGANRVLVIGLSHGAKGLGASESLAQERTVGFGNPMFLLGKILNALMLSPLDADLARLRYINQIVENGKTAYGEDFLDRINAVADQKGDRPIQQIDHVVIRPSVDLGLVAGELLHGRRGNFRLSSFLKIFMRFFGSGADPREADLLSYLLFDTSYTAPLAALGYADAKARRNELASFFSDAPMDAENDAG